MELGEKVAADFFGKHDFRVEKISPKECPGKKSPDFRVYKGDELAFFCEEKSLIPSVRMRKLIKKKLKADGPDKRIPWGGTTVIINDPKNPGSGTRIADHIHTAVEQFKSINPKLEYPNVLWFSNFGSNLSVVDLAQFVEIDYPLSSKVSLQSGPPTGHAVERIRTDKRQINLYIWMDVEEEPSSEPCFLWNEATELCGMLRDSFPKSFRLE